MFHLKEITYNSYEVSFTWCLLGCFHLRELFRGLHGILSTDFPHKREVRAANCGRGLPLPSSEATFAFPISMSYRKKLLDGMNTRSFRGVLCICFFSLPLCVCPDRCVSSKRIYKLSICRRLWSVAVQAVLFTSIAI